MKQFIIAQIGDSSSLTSIVPYGGYVWANRVYVPQPELDESFWVTAFQGTFTGIETEPVVLINSITAKGVPLSLASSLDTMYAVPNSFYWDYDAQTVYVRMLNDEPDYRTPPYYTKGTAIGVCDKADFKQDGTVDVTIGGVAYEPTLVSDSLDVSQGIDNWEENLMIFPTFSVTLINTDGRYDGDQVSLMNQPVTLMLADIADDKELELDDFRVVRVGVVEDISFSGLETTTLNVADPRKAWGDTIGTDVYTMEDFPDQANYPTNLLGKAKPLTIGLGHYVPCYNLTPDITGVGSTWSFQSTQFGPVSSQYTIGVYEETKPGYWPIITDITIDYANGNFTIGAGSNYDGGVLCIRFFGIELDRLAITGGSERLFPDNAPILIALWLIQQFTTLQVNYNTFDIGFMQSLAIEMDVEDALLHIPAGGEALSSVLQRVLLPVGTMLYPKDSRYSMGRISTYTRWGPQPIKELTVFDLTAPPDIVYDQTAYMSRIEYKYYQWVVPLNTSLGDDQPTGPSIVLSGKEEELKVRYSRTRQVDLTSICYYTSQAEDMAQEWYDRFSFIPVVLECSLPEIGDYELFDAVSFEYDWNGRKVLPLLTYRVTGLDPINRTMTLTQYEDNSIQTNAIINLFRRSQGV